MAASVSIEKHKEKLSFLPKKLYDRLMPFQRDGVLFGIAKKGRCLIADEMGLGKTVQALSIAYYYRREWPLLIVVPASLRYPWIEEVEKWLPGIHPHDINLIQGGADIERIPVSRITVVTYGLLRHPSSKVVQEALYNQQFKVIIVDESHYIKNRKTASTKYVVPLLQRTSHKILLTGTPALAKPEELFPQLDSILPGSFGSWTSYANKFCDAKYRYIGRIKKWVTDGASNLDQLQAQLTDTLMIRRLKKDVLKQLPPKQRQRIVFDLKESTVKKELEKAFSELNMALGCKKKSINSVLNGDEESAMEPVVDADPLQVSQPATAGSTHVFGLLSHLYRTTCAAKIGPVKDYMKMLSQNEGLKFIVFAHHHIMMDSLADQLMDDHIKYIRIDGHTPMSDRPKLVHEFQADESIRCAVLSIKAAGVGLTLTAAKLVVFAELDWTPGTLEQCEDRAHRIGQRDQVHVHYLVAKGTLDERVWAALCRKTTVVTTTLNGETQVLKVDEGNERQIQCLANAEAFIPQKRDPGDLATFLHTPQPKNQRSIVDFFTPCGSKRNDAGAVTPTTGKHTLGINGDNRPGVSTRRDIVLLDRSDDDPDEFWSPNTENHEKRKRKKRTTNVMFSDDDGGGSEGRGVPEGQDRTENEGFSDLGCDLDEVPAPRSKRRRVRDIIGKNNLGARMDGAMAQLKDSTKQSKPQSEQTETSGDGLRESEGSSRVSSCGGEQASWSCGRCTYHNNSMLTYCEICSTPKPAGKTPNRTRAQTSSRENGTSSQSEGQSSQTERQRLLVKGQSSHIEGQSSHIEDTNSQTLGQSSQIKGQSSQAVSQNSQAVGQSSQTDDQSSKSHQSIDIETYACDKVTSGDRSDDANQLCNNATTGDSISAINTAELRSKCDKTNCVIEAEVDNQQGSSDNKESPTTSHVAKVTDSMGSCVDMATMVTVVADSDIGSDSDPDVAMDIEDFSDTDCDQTQRKEETDVDIEEPVIEDIDDVVLNDVEQPVPEEISQTVSESINETIVSGTQELCTPKRLSADQLEDCHTPPNTNRPITDSVDDMISMETAAAKQLFSPGFRKSSQLARRPWTCPECHVINDVVTEDCDGCLETRPDNVSLEEAQPVPDTSATKPEVREVNLDNVPVHELFKYCCSKNTSRVYIYDQNDEPLNVNFTPLDVELDNLSELPDLLLRPENLRLVRRMVREWNSLAPTKRRLVIKSGELFTSPTLIYDQLKSGRPRTTQRYTTKLDTASAALSKAEEIGGTIRVINRPKIPSRRNHLKQKKGVQFDDDDDTEVHPASGTTANGGSRNAANSGSRIAVNSGSRIAVNGQNTTGVISQASSSSVSDEKGRNHDTGTKNLTVEQLVEKMQGVVQAVSEDGTPLCVHCHKPYHSELVTKVTIKNNPWQTRFCSRLCMDQHWMRSNRGYSAQQVFNEERGICQICGYDAQQFFTRIKNTRDLYKRAKLIQESKYGILKTEIKQKMAQNPLKGMFWEVDHITPVVEGGGMCDIDNLRTLCVLCHREVTSQLKRDRAKQKQRRAAAQCGDITAFFKVK